MPIHILRDYVTQNISNTNRRFIPAYIVAIFLRRVLGYTYVGDTNFNINSVGSLLIATGDSTPTASTPTFSAGTRAGINFGTGAFFEVSIPVGVRTVVSGDIGRILVLRSNSNPRHNSGCFLITGINSVSNRYIIDYRTNGENPPAEPADSIQWYLYERDSSAPTQGAVNGGAAGTYRGNGSSTTPRVILQSPHSTGYQVRICCETSTDVDNQGVPNVTTAPGFGGNSSGDFAVGGDHLHFAQYLNQSNSTTQAGIGGGDNGAATLQYRITIIGDDTGLSTTMFCRRTLDQTSPNSWQVHFGLPENEPAPLPLNNVSRLFAVGSSNTFASSGAILSDISLSMGPAASGVSQGITMTAVTKQPTACSASLWAYVTGNNQLASPIFDSSAGDCPFTSATELLPVDLLAGTHASWTTSSSTIVFPFEVRPIGTIPHVRVGRANFGNFVLTTDNATWSVTAATNASPIQITTSTSHNLVTGQTVTISGVGGNTAANGTRTVTVLNTTQFTLDGSTGNGAYTSGGTVSRGASFLHTRRGIYIIWNGPSVQP